MNSFARYIANLEERVILEGAKQGCLGKVEKVPVRNGKLSRSDFGKLVGVRLQKEEVYVVDYYGLMKKSDGFWNLVSRTREQYSGKQVKSVDALVVHFASIRIEKVAALAPDLVAGFPSFKKAVLDARGFDHRYGD